MSRRAPGGDADLRQMLDALRERAHELRGIWQFDRVPGGRTIGWRVTMRAVDRHELAILARVGQVPEAEVQRVLDSLPIGYGAVRRARTVAGWLLFAIGRVREQCHRCGREMDDVARMALAETCTACALEAGELAGGQPEPVEITPELVAESYIGRDPDEPGRLAVIHVPPDGGPHRRLAGGFRDRNAVERWLDYHAPKRRASAAAGAP